jgi:hypothetical protein
MMPDKIDEEDIDDMDDELVYKFAKAIDESASAM